MSNTSPPDLTAGLPSLRWRTFNTNDWKEYAGAREFTNVQVENMKPQVVDQDPLMAECILNGRRMVCLIYCWGWDGLALSVNRLSDQAIPIYHQEVLTHHASLVSLQALQLAAAFLVKHYSEMEDPIRG